MKRILIAIMTLAALTACGNKAAGVKEPVRKDIGVQLYSVREILGSGEAIKPVLKQLADLGYTAVEAAGYSDGKIYGLDPAAYKAAVEEAGLQSLSTHVNKYISKEELESGDFTESLKWWDECIAAHKAAGVKYIVMPSMARNLNAKDLKTWCDYFNAVGKKCAEAGILFGYHNHSQEFDKVTDLDEKVYDFMLKNTDPQYVFFEMDVYWACIGRAFPVEYFEKYPGRFKLLHIKDHYDVGVSGMVNFEAIFNNAKTAGVEAIVTEVEGHPEGKTIMDVMKSSADYLLSSCFVPVHYGE